MRENNDQSKNNSLTDFSAQITQAVETAAASIVAIDARPRVATSGIVWRAGGIIVSTHHTIQRDENIKLALSDGRTTSATLVGRDVGTDLAVLKIDDESIATSLLPATLGDTAAVKTGNIVLALGRTSAAGGVTASFGIVNQTGGTWRTWRGDEIERYISLDLAIFMGFSGGALINANGTVLGVNTSAFGRGLRLAIPTETVTRVVDALLTQGRVARPYMGIGAQTVPLPESLRTKRNLTQASGMMLLRVEPDGAAEQGGLMIGDILLTLDDRETLDFSDVQAVLSSKAAGDTVRAQLLRGGEIVEVDIVLAERPMRFDKLGRNHRGCR